MYRRLARKSLPVQVGFYSQSGLPYACRNVSWWTDRNRNAHRELARAFERAHILLHPSRLERFAMVVLEAAAAGLAIVCGGGGGMARKRAIYNGSLTAKMSLR